MSCFVKNHVRKIETLCVSMYVDLFTYRAVSVWKLTISGVTQTRTTLQGIQRCMLRLEYLVLKHADQFAVRGEGS
jgi:hypothetical protein